MQLKSKLLVLTFLTNILFLNNFINAEGRLDIEDYIDTGEESLNDDEILKPDILSPSSTDLTNTESDSTEKPKLSSRKFAKIIVLNKITAQSKELILQIGEAKYFGNIEIKIHKCFKNLNLYAPDNKILMTLTEEKPDEEPNQIFQGWMMSSNISISTFEHPVYEVFAKDCMD